MRWDFRPSLESFTLVPSLGTFIGSISPKLIVFGLQPLQNKQTKAKTEIIHSLGMLNPFEIVANPKRPIWQIGNHFVLLHFLTKLWPWRCSSQDWGEQIVALRAQGHYYSPLDGMVVNHSPPTPQWSVRLFRLNLTVHWYSFVNLGQERQCDVEFLVSGNSTMHQRPGPGTTNPPSLDFERLINHWTSTRL